MTDRRTFIQSIAALGTAAALPLTTPKKAQAGDTLNSFGIELETAPTIGRCGCGRVYFRGATLARWVEKPSERPFHPTYVPALSEAAGRLTCIPCAFKPIGRDHHVTLRNFAKGHVPCADCGVATDRRYGIKYQKGENGPFVYCCAPCLLRAVGVHVTDKQTGPYTLDYGMIDWEGDGESFLLSPFDGSRRKLRLIRGESHEIWHLGDYTRVHEMDSKRVVRAYEYGKGPAVNPLKEEPRVDTWLRFQGEPTSTVIERLDREDHKLADLLRLSMAEW